MLLLWPRRMLIRCDTEHEQSEADAGTLNANEACCNWDAPADMLSVNSAW